MKRNLPQSSIPMPCKKLALTKQIGKLLTVSFLSLSFLLIANTGWAQNTSIIINATTTAGGAWTGSVPSYTFTPSGAIASANVNVSDITTRLATGSVTIVTTNASGTGTGDITVSNGITFANTSTTTAFTLTLTANGLIAINAAINLTGATGAGGNPGAIGGKGDNITLNSGSSSTITISSAITATGGGGGVGNVNGASGGAGNISGIITVTAPGGLTINGASTSLSAIGGLGGNGNAGGSSNAGGAGGAGGTISLSSTGGAIALSGTGTSTLNASGGNAGTFGGGSLGAVGGAGGTINITASGNITTSSNTAIALTGGTSTNNGTSTGAASPVGAMGGSLTINSSGGSVTIGAAVNAAGSAGAGSGNSVAGGLGGAGGAISITGSGTGGVIISSTLSTVGGIGGSPAASGTGTTGGAGGNGGNIILAGSAISTSAAISTIGGIGGVNGGIGGAGGSGGAITIGTIGTPINGTVTIGSTLNSSGGAGTAPGGGNNPSGIGGAASAISIVASGNIQVNSSSNITAVGGAASGASGGSGTAGVKGGAGNSVTINSTAGSVTVTNSTISSSGGAGSSAGGSGSAPGNGGNSGVIALAGSTGITVSGPVTAAGGAKGAVGTGGSAGTGGNITVNDGAAIVTTGGSINDGISGIISGLNFTKNGSGTVRLGAANIYTGSTTISSGALQIGIANAIPSGSNVTLSGGSLSTAGGTSGAGVSNSATLGTLTVTSATSSIIFGTGLHQLNFALASASAAWTSSLTITGWTGTGATSGTGGQLFFGTSSTTLSSNQAASSFTGYTSGAQYLASPNLGQIVPVVGCTPPAPTSMSASATSVCTGNFSTVTFNASTLTAATYSVTYNVSAPNASTGNIASMVFSGSTGTFSTPVLSSAGSNTVTVTAIALASTPSCTVSVSVLTPGFTTTTAPTFTISPSASASTVCVGGTATTFNVAVSGTGITQYQWYSNTSAVNSGGTLVATHSSASTSDSYTTSTASASALYYYCVVTTSAGSCNTATSSVSGLITVVAAPTDNAGTALSGICQGSSAVTIGTGASYGGTATSAVWTDGGAGGTFTNNGGTTPSTTTWAPLSSYSGTVTFTLTTAGGSPCSNATATKTMVVTAAPIFTANPTGSSSVCVGGTGTALTVTVTATGITQYQWFSNTSPVNSGGTVVATHASSSTADTYTTSTVSASALYYYCKVTTSAGSCNAATSSVSGLFTVTAAPTANAGTALSGICQGSSAVTIGTGASYGGTATSAVWTDGGAGGTFTNNGGTTPSTTTWAPPAAYTGTVTFTLTTAGGSPCSNATATKTMVVTGMPNLYTPPATANYIRYDFTSGSSLVNQGTAGGPAVLGTGTGGSIVQTTDRFGNANSAYLLTPGTGGNYWISNTTAVTLTYVPMSEGIWFKTTVAGGTLLGVNSDAAGANNNPDHNLYMDNAGKIVFDIYNGSIHVAVTSPAAYNDGKWHQAVVTTTTTAPQTITLYVDGASVASTSTTLGLTSAGSRFILAGVNNLTFTLGDNPSNWAFTGSVDDIIVYNGTTLTAAQIAGMSAPSITAVANSCSDAVVTLSSYSLATGTYAVTYNVSGTNTVSSTTATMSFTAGSPGTGTFNTANLPNVGSSNVVNVTALSFSSGSCNATLNINTPNFTTTGSNTWLGSSTNWNDVTNWCGGSVPISTTNVIIPNGLTKYPLLGTAGLSTTGYAGSVSIGTTGTGAAASLTVGTGGLLSISGTITNTGGTFDATAGTIEMAGAAAQSITGANFVSQTIYNLMDSTTSGGLSVDSINIVGELGFPFSGTSSLSISKNVVLLSNASTTAWIGPITEVGGTAQATITGKVIIQRYFPAHRRWRLITASVTAASAQTINAAWQEGVVSTTSPLSNPDPLPGYGTHITGPGHYNFAFGLGYDQSPTNSASIAYVHDTSSWFSLPNTNVTKVTDYQGYMLFVRGSRNYTISTTTQTTLATNATLRTTGSPKTGIQNVPVVAGANVIGNPYAATINFNTIFNKATTKAALGSSTANNTFYLWDPNIASAANVASGTGGWVVLTSNGAGAYIPVPDPRSISPFNVNGDIQSGAAFIVHAQTSGFVQIDESDKVSPAATNNDLYLFRPAEAVPLTMLRTTLYATAADTINYLADGVLNIFDNSFTNDVDWNKDIQKQANLNEQCSVFKGGRLIAVQRSSPVNAGDTIFLKLAHLNQRSYRFAFEATSFNRPDLNAYLIDTFMHTNTPISLGDSATDIDFTITTNAGSAAADRFAITFRPAPGSVQYTTVTATQQNKDVLVQWMVKNQLNIKEYIVEKSTDGTNFYPADTTMATSGSTGAIVYNWLDKDPVIGTNYYRIRNIDNNGVYQESNIAKVEIGKGIIAGIAIYPNPVVNGEIGLQMNNVPTGNYRISVIDETGQVILSETIDHGAASETKNISMYKGVAKGIYILDVQFPDNTQTKIKFVNR